MLDISWHDVSENLPTTSNEQTALLLEEPLKNSTESLIISSGILDGSTPNFSKILTAFPLSCGATCCNMLQPRSTTFETAPIVPRCARSSLRRANKMWAVSMVLAFSLLASSTLCWGKLGKRKRELLRWCKPSYQMFEDVWRKTGQIGNNWWYNPKYVYSIYIYTPTYKYIYITFNIDNIDISINSG